MNSKLEAFKKKSNTVIVTVMVVCMLALVVCVVLGKALFDEISFKQHVLSEKRAANTVLAQNVENIPVLTENYQEMQNDGLTSEQVLNALPVTDDFPALATNAERIAELSQVSLGSISVDSSSGSSGDVVADSGTSAPVPVPVQISVRGSYANIVRFLGNLERSARPIVIEELTASGTNQTLTVEVDATTYYQAPTTAEVKTEVYSEN